MSRAPGRPAIHVSAPRGWLSDPNGLCHHDGVWHAYYQHVPDDDRPGDMHWGHATSTDLVRWTDRPIALEPGPLGVVFSGSVVVDRADTAGFGRGSMVAMFTHHSSLRECQSIAASTDGGRTWRLDEANPVLVSDLPDFRDPKVWPLPEPSEARWGMCIGAGRRVEFYRSPDLRNWTHTGHYSLPSEIAGTAECPDVLHFADDTYALMFSAGTDDGRGATYAVVGSYDGARFVATDDPALLDHGPDFYAPQSFYDAPGDPITLGWMGNWRTSPQHPSVGRRGALSFPRRLQVRTFEDTRRVVQRFAVTPWTTSSLAGSEHQGDPGRALHVSIPPRGSVELGGSNGPVVRIAVGTDAVRVWRDDPVDGHVEVIQPTAADGVEVLIDHGTLELVANEGLTWFSVCYFAGPDWTVTVSGHCRVSDVRRSPTSVR